MDVYLLRRPPFRAGRACVSVGDRHFQRLKFRPFPTAVLLIAWSVP